MEEVLCFLFGKGILKPILHQRLFIYYVVGSKGMASPLEFSLLCNEIFLKELQCLTL